MTDSLTARETHFYDQNMAQFERNLGLMLEDWSTFRSAHCCEEHAVINFYDHLTEQGHRNGPETFAGMLLATARRLT